MVRQAYGSDSKLSQIPALTRSHCQPVTADSEPELRSEFERRVSHGHDRSDGQALAQAQAPCHCDPY